ncbi:MAG TPA: hypothetical protein VN825_08540 [Candidatus Acidoferrum sp.]|nr:hypothetical protein [Candidatus Acidoferrum sp.]
MNEKQVSSAYPIVESHGEKLLIFSNSPQGAGFDPARCDGLGIGLFIVRQAIGILGHRIDVASTPCRGSRFSIFASRAE